MTGATGPTGMTGPSAGPIATPSFCVAGSYTDSSLGYSYDGLVWNTSLSGSSLFTTKGNVTVTPNTGVSLYAAGNSISGSHNVTSYGVVTLFAAAANTWYIQGTGFN
jgi:hypothetical protein